MKLRNIIFFVISFFCVHVYALNNYNITPFPNKIEGRSGAFILKNKMNCWLEGSNDTEICRVFDNFLNNLSTASGITLNKSQHNVRILFQQDITLNTEAYILDVSKNSLVLKASSAKGFQYGVQTILQLMPEQIFSYEKVKLKEWPVQCVRIEDTPRFAYRGMHLDEGRHFFGVQYVKKYIDIMAFHKMNTFHWHLTEDQGWRIEIKKYPKLTEVGSIRYKTMQGNNWNKFDETPYGGYYTQTEIKEIVAYAAKKFIKVIPEIDLPGHMMAALASYPELGCTGGPYEVSGQWGVREDVLCLGKKHTMQFIEDVLTEVMDMFPSDYIHIGGDECPKVRWEKCPHCQLRIAELGLKDDERYKKEHYLQSYLNLQIEKFLAKRNRKIIGWDEILEGELSPNATVMSWRGIKGGIDAANEGHDVIMTPNSHLYFDYAQSTDTNREPVGIGGNIPVEKVYSFEPVPLDIEPVKAHHIIGVQGNLWTEYIKDTVHLEYMYLPRMSALSELQWTLPGNKNFTRFRNSFPVLAKRYEQMNFYYAKHLFDVTPAYSNDVHKGALKVELSSFFNTPVYYTLDNSEPDIWSPKYSSPFYIDRPVILKAKSISDSGQSYTLTQKFEFNKATSKPALLNTPPHDKFAFEGVETLVDGRLGCNLFKTGKWIGFYAKPFDMQIDLQEQMTCSTVRIRFLVRMADWIFPPKNIEIYASGNGVDFSRLTLNECNDWKEKVSNGVIEYTCSFQPTRMQYIRIIANQIEGIPQWHEGKGTKPFLFIDEIFVD